MLFKKNTSSPDRLIRIIVGMAILSLVFWGPKSWWALAGLIPLITGLIGVCPLYALVGYNALENQRN